MNKLERLEEFKELLAHYRMSAATKQILSNTQLVLLLGPTAGGRNTIINELVKTGHYHFIVSDTTRKKRVNNGVLEQNGNEYWFRSEDEVLADIASGRYVEAEIIHGQQVSGINIAELERAQHEHAIAINEVDYGGIEAIVSAKPDTLAILVLPPSFEAWMQRLRGRGHMDTTELKRRLETAKIIFNLPTKRDYFTFVINDTVDHAVRQVEAAVRGEPDAHIQTAGRSLAVDLFTQTQQTFASL